MFKVAVRWLAFPFHVFNVLYCMCSGIVQPLQSAVLSMHA